MQVGTTLHGFTGERVRELPELQARLWEMTHEKTGAQLCWLDRADENKAFSIAFKTLPEDSTGVFHILEHSVLCGSDKYPVKEPFVELLKSSVQTFLNAMTYPDKTVYPVSSRNDRDFLNLMDIYLDAVLHPAIYHKSEIFRQEGWRYEGEGEDLCYQGVVLNEMKGAFGSPGTVLENEMNKLLFPDNCYRHVSGGDPEHIVDLTYEQFLANHRKYYHPSNARVSLVGTVDLEAALEKIDGFLRDFDRREVSFDIPMQTPVAAAERTVPYEVGPEEPLEERTIISCGTLLGNFNSRERNYAASVLADYLTGDNDAPLKRAILDAGLGQDIAVGIHDGIQQSWYSWDVWNTDADKLPAIRETIRETLEKIVTDGLDRQRLEACYNHFAFQMRDRDNSGMPRSLVEALELLDTWLYGGDPAQGLLVEDVLESLSAKLDTHYFADLIRELLLDDSHSVTAVLVPSHTLGEEKTEKEAARVAAESAAWTEERKTELRRQAESLARWQQTPDSDEAIATIPMLQLSDLKEKPEPLPMTVTNRGGTTVLRHETGSNLMYLHTYFNASDLKLEELPALVVLTMVLGAMGTTRHSGEELQMLVKQKIGSLSFQPIVLPGSDADHCRVMASAFMACLSDQGESAVTLLREILTETDFNDRKLLRDMLNQSAMGAQMALSANGHQYAITRVGAYNTAHGVAKEYTGGAELAMWFKKISTADDAALDKLLADMERIARQVFTAERLTVSCSEKVTDELLDELIFPAGEKAPAEASYTPLGKRQEGLLIPAAVGFAGKSTSLKRHGKVFNGCIPVLTNVLNFVYLWSEIRVQGGAYGCGFIGRDDGDVGFYTYRDPQPGRSLDVMNQAAAFIRGFCADEPDLTGFILSAVSTLDPLLNTESKMTVAENRYFKGTSYEDACRCYSQLIHSTPADLLALCDVLDDITADNAICVVAGQAQMDGCGDKLTSRLSV